MDELYDKLEAFINAFNESQALINSILAKQNEAAAALAEMVAAVEAMDAEGAEEEKPTEINDPDEAPPIYIAEPSEAPAVSCFTCYAFNDGMTPACQRWQQTPPAEVQAVGCHEWVLSPQLAQPAIPDPEPAPVATAKKKPGPKPKAAPKASRGKANGLEAVPF